jgi:hypothetical protein
VHAHDMNFTQVWNQFASEVDDPDKLASELKELRASLKQQAETAEQDSAVGEVAQAEVAVRNGEGPKGLEHLRKAGKWALDMANSIGATVAAAAIRAALGLP